jgi:hypothetical protein
MNFQFIHVNLEGNPTFMELLERVNKTLLDVYDNYVPFHFITETIKPQGPVVDFQLQTSLDLKTPSASGEPAANVSKPAEPQPFDPSSKSTAGIFAVIPFRLLQSEFALFPIDVFLAGGLDGVNGHFKYQTASYDRSTILKLVNDYIILLTGLARNPALRIQETGINPHPGASLSASA